MMSMVVRSFSSSGVYFPKELVNQSLSSLISALRPENGICILLFGELPTTRKVTLLLGFKLI